MTDLPKLNFPAINLRAQRGERGIEVWDSTRNKWLVLTPEEWVRQHTIEYLVGSCGAQRSRVVQEYAVLVNRQAQRADIVVVGDGGQPLILVECKAPDIKIDQSVFTQASRYNTVLGAQYLIITNGLHHYCFSHHAGEYKLMEQFPQL